MRGVRLSLILVLAGGCALTSTSTPTPVQWYTPERPAAQATRVSPTSGVALRLGRVSSGHELGERIAYGDGAYKVGFYETRRWTKPPEQYVRDALERTLFEEHGFKEVVEGSAPTLAVELTAFQEVRTQQAHLVRVALRGTLATDHDLFAQTFVVDQPVSGARFEDVVAAFSHALQAASEQVARRIGEALAGSPGSHPVGGGP